jgi:hypothetical protein
MTRPVFTARPNDDVCLLDPDGQVWFRYFAGTDGVALARCRECNRHLTYWGAGTTVLDHPGEYLCPACAEIPARSGKRSRPRFRPLWG